MRRRRPRRVVFECPNCGAEVPAGARACRECGSDETTGWQSSEEIDYQSIDLPERDDDGGGTAVGARPARARTRRGWSFWVAVVLLAVVGVYALLNLGAFIHFIAALLGRGETNR